MTFSTGATSSAAPASSKPVNFTGRRASIPKQQEDVALKAHVTNVCFKYFRCMLQVFYMDVAKAN
jgi:hypothetical protein